LDPGLLGREISGTTFIRELRKGELREKKGRVEEKKTLGGVIGEGGTKCNGG